MDILHIADYVVIFALEFHLQSKNIFVMSKQILIDSISNYDYRIIDGNGILVDSGWFSQNELFNRLLSLKDDETMYLTINQRIKKVTP